MNSSRTAGPASAPRQIPAIRFPEDLPISQKREEIGAAIRDHQVVIVCGETGSGKTTQLPKICLDQGRGRRQRIGHTQPRRIAARAVAERIAEELDSELGELVGYKVRFSDRTTPKVAVKLMTDGILLNEIQRDPLLREYDTLILDEAHERSLNVDFLLGYMKRILPRRPELRVIITSATIQPEAFADHFGAAPIIEVSGRTYPVEVVYRPVDEDAEEDNDYDLQLLGAVEETLDYGPGDILIFFSGEREIREAGELLERHYRDRLQVLPLFGRLASDDQHRIFSPGAQRRVVLATNIAETSLTVPGVRYVIDTGRARISRFNPRTKVQRLPIEPISKASAKQRAGRCGRVADGVCTRLYSEEDFEERDDFTPPEILRTNLAAVILQMKVMGLGDLEDFPFLDPPDPRAGRAGLRLLQELGALDEQGQPTELGRRLSRFPVDPRIGRIILAAHDRGCLRAALIIASALSIQDPRERPSDNPEAADQSHARFDDPRSDFLGILKLWDELLSKRESLSRNQFRKWCKASFLSASRVREWSEVHRQLGQICRELRGMRLPRAQGPVGELDEAGYAALHRALLTGLLSNVGNREEEGSRYRGTANKTFWVFPGSALFRKQPKWIVTAELVETARLYGRRCAACEPKWIEEVATHLLKRSHSEPWWDSRSGLVMAKESVSYSGLVLAAGRRVDFGPIDPTAAREIFLRSALTEGRLRKAEALLDHNRRLIVEIADLEDKARRRNIFVGEEALYRLYEQRVPSAVRDAPSFEAWRRREESATQLLRFTREDLVLEGAGELDSNDFPHTWRIGELELPLSYHFEPGSQEDGVSVEVPLALLGGLRPEPFEWLVPGYLSEKVLALVRTLPKRQRKSFLPLAETADAFLDLREARSPSLLASLQSFLERRGGFQLGPRPFDEQRVPEYLRVRFVVVGDEGKPLGEGRDLSELQERLAAQTREEIATLSAGSPWERPALQAWDFGELPEAVEIVGGGSRLLAFPALIDRGESVDLGLSDTAERATLLSLVGVSRLLLLTLPEQDEVARKAMPTSLDMRLRVLPSCPFPGSLAATERSPGSELVLAAARSLVSLLPRTSSDFREIREILRGRLWQRASELAGLAESCLEGASLVAGRIASWQPGQTRTDIESQLQHLFFRGFLLYTPYRWLPRLRCYLHGLELRLDKASQDAHRDLQPLADLEPVWQPFLAAAKEHLEADSDREPWIDYRFRIEELRLSIFAQEVKTAMPVSTKRLSKLWGELVDDP